MYVWPNKIDTCGSRKNELNVKNYCISWRYRVIIPSFLINSMLYKFHFAYLFILKLVISCQYCIEVMLNPPKFILYSWNVPSRPLKHKHI